MNPGQDVKKILVINFGGIGDILLSSPALRALRKLYPQAHIAFLGVPRTNELAKNLKVFDELIPLGAYDEKQRSFYSGGVILLIKLLVYLKNQKFDMAINMRTIVSWCGSLKMACLFFIIGSRYRVGRDTNGKGFFFNIKVPEKEPADRYEMDYDLETVRALGADISDRSFNNDIFGTSGSSADAILEKNGMGPSDPFIVINAGGMPSRRWPVENFITLSRDLILKLNCRIVLIGGTNEAVLSSRVKQSIGDRIIDLTGRLGLAELAAVLKKATLLITNDTGPMHIAAVLKTPLIAIFGGGQVTRFDPRRISEKAVLLYKKADCAPCNKMECRTLKCLKDVKVEDVREAVLQLLS